MTKLIDEILREYRLFNLLNNLLVELSLEWICLTNFERSTFMNEDDFVNVRLREFLHAYLINEEIKRDMCGLN